MHNVVSLTAIRQKKIAQMTPWFSPRRGKRMRFSTRAKRLTRVSWDPSLAATSEMLLALAWCCVTAALVAPPATPTSALATLAAHRTSWRARRGRSGPASSSIMAASLRTSAKRRHFLQAWSRSVPRSQVKAMPPAIPAPSRSSHVIVADRAVADSSPTPTPFNTAYKA